MPNSADPSLDRPARIAAWRDAAARQIVIAPSMLQCDYLELRREIERLEEAGAQTLHLDVMDGNFVPNLSYGFPLVAAMRQATSLPLDAHLMISNPGKYVSRYIDYGCDNITIHVEATDEPAALLASIREQGVSAGLALNPPTPLAKIEGVLQECDLVLVMSVMPGFGGQEFDPRALDKLRELQGLADRRFMLQVDGGVNAQTIRSCREAGADIAVVGSALMRSSNYIQTMQQLFNLAQAES